MFHDANRAARVELAVSHEPLVLGLDDEEIPRDPVRQILLAHAVVSVLADQELPLDGRLPAMQAVTEAWDVSCLAAVEPLVQGAVLAHRPAPSRTKRASRPEQRFESARRL